MQDGDSDDDADDGSSGDADHRLVLGDDDGSSSDADKVSVWVPGQNVGSYIKRDKQPDHQCQVLVCNAMTTLNGLPKTPRGRWRGCCLETVIRGTISFGPCDTPFFFGVSSSSRSRFLFSDALQHL